MPDNTLAIHTDALRKVYGAKVAVDALSLNVERGQIFGFLGPNGAGKSTTVKMLLDLVHPTSGHAEILGEPSRVASARARVGFLPEDFQFQPWLTGAELLDLHARLHGLASSDRSDRIPELLHLVGLTEAGDRALGAYSKGMRQRLGLAQALIHDPELVFLDEPTSGLDPLGRRLVRQILGRLRDRGVTVFLNSHFLSEVERTCTRVAFVANGRVKRVADAHDDGGATVQLTMRLGHVDEAIIAGLGRWTNQAVQREQGHTLSLSVADEGAIPEITRWLVGLGVDLYAITPRTMSLEDQFVAIMSSDQDQEVAP